MFFNNSDKNIPVKRKPSVDRLIIVVKPQPNTNFVNGPVAMAEISPAFILISKMTCCHIFRHSVDWKTNITCHLAGKNIDKAPCCNLIATVI
tara:strand:+ start:288 stop:563 length:276 start_codon:yes stop_codon:yes gene_type:complete